jgi:hypothetical protein
MNRVDTSRGPGVQTRHRLSARVFVAAPVTLAVCLSGGAAAAAAPSTSSGHDRDLQRALDGTSRGE